MFWPLAMFCECSLRFCFSNLHLYNQEFYKLVSFTFVFGPESALKTVDLNAKGVGYLTQMWATRQFAVGFIFAFATLKKSIPMLTIAYLFFLVMNIGDFFVGISQQDSSLYIGAIVMCIISTTMLYFINKQTK